MTKCLRKLLLAAVILSAAPALAQDVVLQQAQDQVERLHEALLQAMQQPDAAAREALLEPVIVATFDVTNIARISIGRTWRKITPQQRAQLVEDLQTLIVATYADRFDAFNQQQFVTQSVEAVKTGPVVKTQLIRVDDDPVSLDYYLRGDGIFNVVADGVSDLSLRRADYNSIIKQQGFEALMLHVSQKIGEARSEAG